MATFFSHQRGSVMRLDGLVQTGAMPFAIRMSNMDIGGATNPETKAIITQAALVENGNYQLAHSLSDTIYLYVFGDRMGELRVSGMAFSKLCIGDEETGVEQAIRNYRDNRIAVRSSPVIVSYGSNNPFRAFLTGMSIDLVDPERMLAQWSYRFEAFPGRG